MILKTKIQPQYRILVYSFDQANIHLFKFIALQLVTWHLSWIRPSQPTVIQIIFKN